MDELRPRWPPDRCEHPKRLQQDNPRVPSPRRVGNHLVSPTAICSKCSWSKDYEMHAVCLWAPSQETERPNAAGGRRGAKKTWFLKIRKMGTIFVDTLTLTRSFSGFFNEEFLHFAAPKKVTVGISNDWIKQWLHIWPSRCRKKRRHDPQQSLFLTTTCYSSSIFVDHLLCSCIYVCFNCFKMDVESAFNMNMWSILRLYRSIHNNRH